MCFVIESDSDSMYSQNLNYILETSISACLITE